MFNVPGTIDEWFDESANKVPEVTDLASRPLFLAAFTADRGPTGLRRVSGQDFYKLYGLNCSYKKHGQPLIQAAAEISAGAELLCARVVAKDATLANLIITATVTAEKTQKIDIGGNPLYIDPITGDPTTEAVDPTTSAPNEKLEVTTAKVKYDAVTIENVKSYQQIEESLKDMVNEDIDTNTFTYPVFVVVDNGLGESTKRFRIVPNYTLSKSLGFVLYRFIYMGQQDFDYEYVNFSTVIGKSYNGQSMSLDMTTRKMLQLEAHEYEDGIESMYNRIAELTGVDAAELSTIDILLAKSSQGKPLTYLDIDTTGLDLSAEVGAGLMSGTNGAFGDAPINAGEEYEEAITSVFNGELTDDIYDLDRFQIDACFDADYPQAAKNAIVDLAEERHDFMYFGDLGSKGLTSYDMIASAAGSVRHSKYAAYYFQYGNIIDPFSLRCVTVTITYALAKVAVEHMLAKPYAPYCGITHGFKFPEFIEGSINFLPKDTPKMKQKKMIQEELGLNYASILNNVLTLETENTSQAAFTQLSFINNVTGIQQVIKDIRRACPSCRYAFQTEDDVDNYQKKINEIVTRHATNYALLEATFEQDDIMKANKLFEFNLKFRHKQFYTAEKINVYTLGIAID